MGVETIGRLNVASVDPISDASFTKIAKKKMRGASLKWKKRNYRQIPISFFFYFANQINK